MGIGERDDERQGPVSAEVGSCTNDFPRENILREISKIFFSNFWVYLCKNDETPDG